MFLHPWCCNWSQRIWISTDCPDGRFGWNCKQKCPDGYYGRLCTSKCSCEKCDPVTGCDEGKSYSMHVYFFFLHFSMYVSSLSLCRQLTDILSVRQTSVDSIISYIFIFSPKNLNIKFEVGILFNSVILCVRNKYDRLIFSPWITDGSHFCYWAYPSSHKYTTNSYLLTSSFQYNSPSIWKLICSCKRSHIYLSEHYL